MATRWTIAMYRARVALDSLLSRDPHRLFKRGPAFRYNFGAALFALITGRDRYFG